MGQPFAKKVKEGGVRTKLPHKIGIPARIRTSIGGFGDRSPTIERQVYLVGEPGFEPEKMPYQSIMITISSFANLAGQIGFEPTTQRLTVSCSTD